MQQTLNADRPAPVVPLSTVRHAKTRNEPKFDARAALYTLLDTDLV